MYTIIVNTPGPQGPTGPQGPAGTGSIDTSSLATTGSNTFIGNQTVTGSIDITGSLTVNTVNVGANTINFIDENQNILTSLSYSGSNLILSSGSIALSTGSLVGTASYANEALTASYALNTNITIDTSSIATTGSNTFNGDQIINGENLGFIVDASNLKRVGFMKYGGFEGSIARVANQNFRILRTTGSNINDGTNAITDFYIAGDGKIGIGTTTPAYTLDVSGSSNFTDGQTIVGNVTFPSGSFISTTNESGSLFFSSLNGGILQLNADGGEGDVLIGYNGWGGKLKVRGDVEITGSLIITNGISGSFSGSGENLYNIPSSAITGLNLSQIASGSYSASISDNKLLVNTSVTATYFIGDGSQLTGIFLEKRHDFTGSYSYCGTAPSGSSELANVWDINRITIYPAGNTLIQSASLVSWTNRYNNIYN